METIDKNPATPGKIFIPQLMRAYKNWGRVNDK